MTNASTDQTRLQLTADAIAEQFNAIDLSAFPEGVRNALRSYESVIREFFGSKRPKVDTGPRYGFRSSYLAHGKSEEESAILELLEELFDALCYLMIFKHMYRKGHGKTMIPTIETALRESEESLLALILVGRILLNEAEKLATLQEEARA